MRKETPRSKRAKKGSSSDEAKVGEAKVGEAKVGEAKAEDEQVELPTELCLGSDGVIYVNAQGIAPEKIRDRKMFYGYAMTEEEMEVAVDEIHRLAFNVTVSMQEAMRQRSLRREKQSRRRQKKSE
ncbi:hypothetical protein [Polyangium aurulentum]|uniref:hypothetical protein n=1 Tax=Polyangium aurulentum TaxID=2567896 RepID=UPI0010AEDF23|nr:hypothetical protein [Polyangium aurulentum]UQA62436.1 hypothetical protein E8A73_019045 [Polyangium aurulentum]